MLQDIMPLNFVSVLTFITVNIYHIPNKSIINNIEVMHVTSQDPVGLDIPPFWT